MRVGVDHRREFGDFTEAGYRELLLLARSSYRFARFGDGGADRHVLWRHDIDISVNRAVRLAEIEAEQGVTATYFLRLRSPFYNLLNQEMLQLVDRIVALGHDIGLHFDPSRYESGLSRRALEAAIGGESELLAREFGAAPRAVSFHDVSALTEPVPDDERLCGLVNTYSGQLRDGYGYVSDSNGIWLYRRLRDVLEAAAEDRLQVLTHPEWWTPEVMAPRQRVQRAIDGNATALAQRYDASLALAKRPNMR
jgi:peptidoglycan/xylan/chitin deacetylase (PgdA/CDA1 family)